MISPPAGVEVLERVAMAPLTTMGTGGVARHLARPDDARQALAVVRWARDAGLPLWVLGGGSNVLVADAGLDGVVLQPAGEEIQAVEEGGGVVRVEVQAGRALDELVAWAVARDLGGLSCLSGIPGTVGAAPVQNVGAYGQAMGDALVSVSVLDCETGQLSVWPAEHCDLGYRDSVFRRAAPGRFVILSATLRLRSGVRPDVRHEELRRRLGMPLRATNGVRPPLGAVRAAVLSIRRDKGMVIDPRDPDSRSAGSFFVNPVVTQAAAEVVRERLAGRLRRGERMPEHRVDPRDGQPRVKLSAAWLIERCGMPRGYGEGRVGLSPKHVLALINRGGATTAEVLAFAAHVAGRVEATCGVRLRREPVLMGPAG